MTTRTPAIHPLVPDAQCDGVDDNCNGILDEEFVDHVSTCGVGACASTGFAHCEFGVFSDTCAPGTPSAETCNGIDDNCDGTVDNAAVPTGTPSVVLAADSGGAATLTWAAVSARDRLRRRARQLATLRSSGGNFTTATTNCLGQQHRRDDGRRHSSRQRPARDSGTCSAPPAAVGAPATTPALPSRSGPAMRRSPRRAMRARDARHVVVAAPSRRGHRAHVVPHGARAGGVARTRIPADDQR